MVLRYVKKVNTFLKRETPFNLKKKMVSISAGIKIRAQAYVARKNSSIKKNNIRTSSSIYREKDCKLKHLVDPLVLFISMIRHTSLGHYHQFKGQKDC